MPREEIEQLSKFRVALDIALKASNPRSTKDVEQVGLAVWMALGNDPSAPSATLAEDALLTVTPS
jgi:hypothetical protein